MHIYIMAQKTNVISLQSCIFPCSKQNIKADFLNLSALNMYINITINYKATRNRNLCCYSL